MQKIDWKCVVIDESQIDEMIISTKKERKETYNDWKLKNKDWILEQNKRKRDEKKKVKERHLLQEKNNIQIEN